MQIDVIVKPGRKNDKLIWDGKVLTVWVKAQAKKGQANVYLIKFLADFFKITKSHVVIKSGHLSRQKLLEIEADKKYLQNKLDKLKTTDQQRLF